MKLLVTGGAGYLGSTLAPMLLERGHRVCVLDSLRYGGVSLLPVWTHPNFTFVRGDVSDQDLVEQCLQDVEGVVHLAAIVGDPACSREADLARSVNLDASLALVESCRRAGVRRFVFASTCSNYGQMPDLTEYVDERSELKPLSLYAETKVAVEGALLDSDQTNGFCPTVLRFATLFGVSPRMRFDLTVNEFTLDMLTAKPLVVYGEQFWRPYVHVWDAARAILTVLGAPVQRVATAVFNVGATDQNFQKKTLVELIRPHAPRAVVEYVSRNEDPRDYRVSFAKVASQLGFKISRTVDDGILEIAGLIKAGVMEDYRGACYRNSP